MNTAVETRGAGPSLVAGGERSSAPRVGIIGTYGHGNLGDEAVFVSFVQWVGENAPHVAPVALCVNPVYIEKTYGVSAHPVAARYAADTGRRTRGGKARSSRAIPEHQPVGGRGAVHRPPGRLRRVAARSVPAVKRLLRPGWRMLQGARIIARFLPRQLRIMRSLDGVIVLGGGQIHDFWDGPLGHPVTLFSWALACRLTGKPFAILSIGAIDLVHGMSRRFVRAVFRWSVYSSVRDRESAARVQSLGVSRACAIYPDLAWGLDLERFISRPVGRSGRMDSPAPRDSSSLTVGICPMAYRHPELWAKAEADAEGYARYIDTLAAFCNKLLDQGHELVLFPTQILLDTAPVRDVLDRISPELVHRVSLRPVGGVADLVNCLASVDAVVSSRFHGVLLSLCAGRPVISLAYQQKCNALLEELGEGQFGLDIHDFSAQELWERFERLQGHFGAYAARLQAHVEENRRKLHAQYEDYFARLR